MAVAKKSAPVKKGHIAGKPATKAPAAKKGVAVRKAPTSRTLAARKATAKGDAYECGVCGLSMTVDEITGDTELVELICCEKVMKAKKPAAKAKAKAK